MNTRLSNPRTSALAVILALTLSTTATPPLLAGTRIWNGGATPDGNWTTPGDWGGTAPATNDLLIITGGTHTTATNNFPAATPFENISFSSGASAFTL